MDEVYVGRQPIYDHRLNVVGYELLFRRFDTDRADLIDGDSATSQVIMNTFVEIGLDRLVGKARAFVNLTRNFLLEHHPIPLPPRRVVLEVLENISLDTELVNAVRGLAGRGFLVALDDVVCSQEWEPLLDIAHIAKLDLMEIEKGDLGEQVAHLRKHNLKLIAEKIETQNEFDECKNMGFDYFQGYFLSRPNVISGQHVSTSKMAIIRALAVLQENKIEFKKLEEIVRQDLSLSYKLLRVINTAFFAKHAEINSIGQALTYLGLRQVQAWMRLLLLARIEGKPPELMKTALVRAKMCELVSLAMRERRYGPDFTVGLFSALDALLDLSLEEIIGLLPLSQEIEAALLRHDGRMGRVLHAVLAYEQGEWEEVGCLDLNPESIRDSYLESLNWANSVVCSLRP